MLLDFATLSRLSRFRNVASHAHALGFGAALAGAAEGQFALSSTDIEDGKPIQAKHVFNGFGCSGQNVSPALSWSHAPPGTQSFALLVHDPDAPTDGGWWHWVVYDIPANVHELPAGAGSTRTGKLPTGGVQGRTDFGTNGYGGPCPPPGRPHHYHFRLYALKVAKLDVPADAAPATVDARAQANALATAEIVPIYARQ